MENQQKPEKQMLKKGHDIKNTTSKDDEQMTIPELLDMSKYIKQMLTDKTDEDSQGKKKDTKKEDVSLPPEIMGQISKFLPKGDKINFRLAGKDMERGVHDYFKMIEDAHGDAIKCVFTYVGKSEPTFENVTQYLLDQKCSKCFMISNIAGCAPGLALSIRSGKSVSHLVLAPSIAQMKTPLLRLDLAGLKIEGDVKRGSPSEEKKIIHEFFKNCIIDEQDLVMPFPTSLKVTLKGRRAYGDMKEDKEGLSLLDEVGIPMQYDIDGVEALTNIPNSPESAMNYHDLFVTFQGRVKYFPTSAHKRIAEKMAKKEKSNSEESLFFVCFYPCGLLPSWQVVTTKWRCRAYPFNDLEENNPFQYALLIQKKDASNPEIKYLRELFKNSSKKSADNPITIMDIITFLTKKGGYEFLSADRGNRRRGLVCEDDQRSHPSADDSAALFPTITIQTKFGLSCQVRLSEGGDVNGTLLARMFGVESQRMFLQDASSGVFTSLQRLTKGRVYVLHTAPLA